ncbi:MAG: formate dehydrogenase accessory sulfurtransferase FdhD, partial [Ferruginibacter sp.]
MDNSSSLPTGIIKVNASGSHAVNDLIAMEEPLEIRIRFEDAGQRIQKNISVTMRTPGNDFELSAGFLFTEGIIKSFADIQSIQHCNGRNENVVRVELKGNVKVEINKLERNFYTTSSCGVCGKSSIEAVKTVCRIDDLKHADVVSFSAETIYTLPAILRNH